VGAVSNVAVVIPCYNEVHRLDEREFAKLAARDDLLIVLVDDGSVDGTERLLHRLAAAYGEQVRVVMLGSNRGKGEAIRAGLTVALDENPEFVGYLDADFATAADEFLRLVDIAHARPGASAVLGSRVALLGRSIRRRPARHYMGRIFATLASVILRMRVYDTQCGAKVFRATPQFRRAVATPFTYRWIFDVELLSRLTRAPRDALGAENFVEVPLRE